MPVTESFTFVPENLTVDPVEKAERIRKNSAKHDATRTDKYHGNATGRHAPYATRNFIIWDGEGPRDTGYSLLGNSEGEEICYPKLETVDCLELLLQSTVNHPSAIHLAFGFGYDISNILWRLPKKKLWKLWKNNITWWNGYRIEHIPRKWFVVQKDGRRIKIFDVQSFFSTGLVAALEKWKIGPFADSASDTDTGDAPSIPPMFVLSAMAEPELVRLFKKLRGEFLWRDIKQITYYMHLELKYTKILMEGVRNAFSSAGYLPRSWHGPGAIARLAFRRHGIYNVLDRCPSDVAIAAQYAFVAGRFELFKAGHVGRVYTADINSAYPWFCSQLPNLRSGKWRHTDTYETAHFALWRIRYDHRHRDGRCNRGGGSSPIYEIYPLPRRKKDGEIVWGPSVEGWYWNPEAELVKDDPDATIIEGWVFDEDNTDDRPFAWIADYYATRNKWKAEGNPAEYTLKLIINAIYGQLAQRVGWDKKKRLPPKTHQLEFAGWITSNCRAMVYGIARGCGNSLVSIDTDGVTSRKPFRNMENSDRLGEWKLEAFEDSVFWQSGIYFLKEKDKWNKARTRGISKGSYTVDQLFECLRDDKPLVLQRNMFIGYNLALHRNIMDRVNTWEVTPVEITMGGSGKRFHRKTECCYRVVGTRGTTGEFDDPTQKLPRMAPDSIRRIRHKSPPKIHRLALSMDFSFERIQKSEKHKLPWVDSDMGQQDEMFELANLEREYHG